MRSTEQNRKELILETAQELFYRNGYDSTSVRELAKETGLSVAGVYYFFSDKEDILFTCRPGDVIAKPDLIFSKCEE